MLNIVNFRSYLMKLVKYHENSDSIGFFLKQSELRNKNLNSFIFVWAKTSEKIFG